MPDLDQGGVFRETTRVYQGPSLGWSQQVAAPPVAAITVTTAGTTTLQQGISTVHVNVNGAVTIQLYAARGNAAGAGQVPGSFVQVTLTVNDIGGFASTFPITILPAAGETIGGSTSVTIAANYGLFVLLSDVQNGGWTVASGVSGTAIADAPSDGTAYGRKNATWVGVLPLAGGTMTGALVMAGVSTAPTAAVDTSTTQVANTAFVLAQASASGDGTPVMDGVAARGTSTHYARADHVHPVFALRGYLSGLTLSTAGASATFSVAAGQATDSTNANYMTLASALAKNFASSWSVGNNGGALDTGVTAANTWYHAHLIKRPDTGVVDALVSLSATAPTLPTNYTLFRRIGSMKTNGSSQWTSFHQYGDKFLWDTPAVDIGGGTIGTTSTAVGISTPAGVVTEPLVNISGSRSAAQAILYVRSPNAADIAASSGSIAAFTHFTNVTSAASWWWIDQRILVTGLASEIYIRADAASTTYSIGTWGWIDRRGRDA